jgi:hypothetical protein
MDKIQKNRQALNFPWWCIWGLCSLGYDAIPVADLQALQDKGIMLLWNTWNWLPNDVMSYSKRTVIKKYIGLTRECVIYMFLIKGLATYLFIYLFTGQFVLTVVWLCKILLEDQFNNISYESGILYYRTEGVWCENFCKSDIELQTHASTIKCAVLYTVRSKSFRTDVFKNQRHTTFFF